MIPQNTYIIGYSLDACLYARELADAGTKITFLCTGELGYPLDFIKDFLSESGVNTLKAVLPELTFKKHPNYTRVFLPYNQLDFVNSHNGLISYPLNKSSFECAEEWEQIENCILNADRFLSRLDESNNYVNIYKKFFPKWLYDSLIKHISVNKWGGLKQSKFSKDCLLKEIDISRLAHSGTNMIYSPDITYSNICRKLLSHRNITLKKQALDPLKKIMTERHKLSDIIFMDNRVDYLSGFSQGKFDRINIKVEETTDQHMEEFIELSDGFVYTPMKEYWGARNNYGSVIKIYSNEETGFVFKDTSALIPTINNEKIYEDYKKLLNLYSGKHLILDKFIDTILL